MATNPAARHHLIEQLKAHTMKREYVAFVDGRPATPSGTWRQWLQLSRDELRQHVLSETQPGEAGPDASEAITHFEVVAEYPLAGGKSVVSQLRLRLETGRKHQIRVQAAHAGVPLIGDRTYNPAYRGSEHGGAPIEFPRQALHAEVLSLEHPEQPGKRMTWTASSPKTFASSSPRCVRPDRARQEAEGLTADDGRWFVDIREARSPACGPVYGDETGRRRIVREFEPKWYENDGRVA